MKTQDPYSISPDPQHWFTPVGSDSHTGKVFFECPLLEALRRSVTTYMYPVPKTIIVVGYPRLWISDPNFPSRIQGQKDSEFRIRG